MTAPIFTFDAESRTELLKLILQDLLKPGSDTRLTSKGIMDSQTIDHGYHLTINRCCTRTFGRENIRKGSLWILVPFHQDQLICPSQTFG